MSNFQYLPISCLDEALLRPLMEDEERAWMSDLNWDYAPVLQILTSFIRQKLLPGYVAVADDVAVGYTYFLRNQDKGIIGTAYAMPGIHAHEAIDELLSLSISSLKDWPNVRRVEAQIMPFHNVNLTDSFKRHGFHHLRRYYLELNLCDLQEKVDLSSALRVIPWDNRYLPQAAEIMFSSYKGQVDAEICDDYCSRTGCEGYLRSIMDTPGCGTFMPEVSLVGVDWQGTPCGFIFCCRIAPEAAIIPQIVVHPLYQGKRLGNALMHRALLRLQAFGFRSVSLTVTGDNIRAFDWYQKLGFVFKKEFGAYVWKRSP